VPSVKQPVDFTGVQFAGHCNEVDVIPVLEWTQLSILLYNCFLFYDQVDPHYKAGVSWLTQVYLENGR